MGDDRRRGRDIDDAHAEEHHRRRFADALGETEPQQEQHRGGRRRSDDDDQPTHSGNTTAGHLAFTDGGRRARIATGTVKVATPTLGDAAEAILASEDTVTERALTHVTEAKVKALPTPEFNPPSFLSPLEKMRDVYRRTKGRASPRTQRLLESPALEDLLETLLLIAADDRLALAPEARLPGPC